MDVTNLDEAVDKALNTIDQNSEEWQTSLQEVLRFTDDLSGEVGEIIENDLSNLLGQSIALVGVETRCTVGFISERVSQTLEKVKAFLRGEEYRQLPPTICSTVPSSLRTAQNSSDFLTFYGYDLNYDNGDSGLSLELKNDNVILEGGEFDSIVSFVNEYTLKVTLNDFREEYRLPLTDETTKVSLIYTDYDEDDELVRETISTIPVTQRPPEKVRTDGLNGEATIIPTRFGGDSEFNGHGPEILFLCMVNSK